MSSINRNDVRTFLSVFARTQESKHPVIRTLNKGDVDQKLIDKYLVSTIAIDKTKTKPNQNGSTQEALEHLCDIIASKMKK